MSSEGKISCRRFNSDVYLVNRCPWMGERKTAYTSLTDALDSGNQLLLPRMGTLDFVKLTGMRSVRWRRRGGELEVFEVKKVRQVIEGVTITS